MTSKRQQDYRNKDFAKYYDGVTIFLLMLSFFFLVSIFSTNELGLGFFVFSFIMGCVGYQIGFKKNRNPVRWFCFGFLLNILIFLIVLTDYSNQQEKIHKKNKEIYKKNNRFYNNPQETLIKAKLLQANENIIFQQTATYKGGISGYPKASEDPGVAFILDNAFIFYNYEIQFKLLFKNIIEAKLDFFQMSEARGIWAFGDGGRQLQQTKNTIELNFIDDKSIERSTKFQIHGALSIPGEEVKAREFLNHLLEFKDQFMISNNQFLSQSKSQLDNFSKLEKLKQLKDQGIISDREFEIKKQQFLDEM
jgi:Short C-terminal domain